MFRILKNELEKGNWAIFYDEKRNMYNLEYSDGMKLIERYNCTRSKLFVNCRNIVQIGTYGFKTREIEINEILHENGERVQKIVYTTMIKLILIKILKKY